jgi:hypothetical protein
MYIRPRTAAQYSVEFPPLVVISRLGFRGLRKILGLGLSIETSV